ncbi:MAG: methyltransferase [Proteobacteria bacterium]|nr:methyltransferase [Pseudomonadota bacterium]MDA1302468.1 methyltransferase [Pseudomonadota bacterium]
MSDVRPDSSGIVALSTAFWDAQVLLTANRIGVFDALANGPLELEAICEVIGTAPRPTRLLLRSCVALGLLEESDGRFRPSPAGEAYLVPGKPGYLGNAIRYSDNLYDTWGHLEQALREDRPQMANETYLGGDAGVTRDFVYGMHNRALGIGRMLVELVDLAGRNRLLDIGGGPGTYSALFAQRFPDLVCRVFDLPGVVAHAADIVKTMGVSDRVETAPGDYTVDEFPDGNDAVLISGVFHRETEAGCRTLIEKAGASLDPGGMLIICDVFTDAGGTSPAFATVFGLNMLLTAPDGGVRADADVSGWMKEAGFETHSPAHFPPPMPHRVVWGIRR